MLGKKIQVAGLLVAGLLLAAVSADAGWTNLSYVADQNTQFLGVGARGLDEACAVGFVQAQQPSPLYGCFSTTGTSTGTFSGYGLSIAFADEQSGTIGGLVGKAFHTTDGGASWIELPEASLGSGLTDSDPISDVVYSLDGSRVVLAGESGSIARSEDGGATWQILEGSVPAGAVFAAAISGDHVWLAGGEPSAEPVDDEFDPQPGHPAGSGFVLHSSDGGSSFATLVSGLPYCVFDIDFVNPAEGWLAGGTDTTEGDTTSGAVIGRTADGGESWTTVVPPDLPENEVAGANWGATGLLATCKRVEFYGREVGLALCSTATFESDGSTGLYRSTDGGGSWELQPGYLATLPGLGGAMETHDMAMPDCHGGWVVGAGKLVQRWDSDDTSIDCEQGGGPSEEAPDGLGDGGADDDDDEGGDSSCGCQSVGSLSAGFDLLGILFRAFGG